MKPEVEAEMTRRAIWSKTPKRDGFPTCLGCAELFDPDFQPEKLPAPEADLCSVCVREKGRHGEPPT